MDSRIGLFACLLVLLAVVVGTGVALGKGMSSITGATISGGDLKAPRKVRINLPEGQAEMSQVDVPAYQRTSPFTVQPCRAWPVCVADGAPAPREPSPGEVPYDIVLHYDFARYGGKRDWPGRFDGKDILYFPEHMQVGNGLWAAGWYEAAPALRDRLNGSLHPTLWSRFMGMGGMLALGVVGSAAVVIVAKRWLTKRSPSFVEPETAPPHLIAERLRSRELRF